MPPTEVDQNYLAGVRKRLDPLFAAGPPESFDAVGDRLVVFSDHHRGTGGGEDDFRRCEHAYTAALGFYLESDYRLLLLGDVEELWEVAQPERIFTRYEHVLGLERSFAERGKLERFWGNHDDLWANEGRVRNRLRPVIGPDAPVRETLKMKVECPGGESGTVFFAHGHQGTPESDSWVSKLTRLPVRFIWPLIQRFFNASATTPAQDHELRGRHDTALFHWAAEQPGRILVAGHTHRPVFSDSKPRPPVTRPVSELEAELARAKAAGDRALAARTAVELEYARTLIRRPEQTVEISPPCYFNTGCCSFPDGDITGLEMADEQLRLVRWPANLKELRREGSTELDFDKRVLVSVPLATICEAVGERREPRIVEQELAAGLKA